MLPRKTKGETTPTPVWIPLLYRYLKGLTHNHDWNYRAAVGILSYLQDLTRPDIAMAVHQCAHFSNDPMLFYEQLIKKIVEYLMKTADRGIVYKPDATKGIECLDGADLP